jgi:hypothetical protein
MIARLLVRAARAGMMLLGASAVMFAVASSASAMPVYNNIPTKLPRGLNSIGFEATSTSQFGGLIELSKTRRGRANPVVTFVLDDWACQSGGGATCTSKKRASYPWPVTVNLYEVGAEDTVGSLIASQTQTITVPYQPSTGPECTGEATGAWYNKTAGECQFGYAFKAKIAFPSVTLPSQLIVGIAYNTEDHGAEPTGTPGPEDSLNLALMETAPKTGSDPLPEDVFVNSSWSEMYCEGATDVGTFGSSGACWAPYQVALGVNAER